ncbi:anaerobic nitric oxide reductase transcription regulator NorR [Paraliobacillus ryukyuensis]|uniref:Transcriptional regulator with PAS, ATPase and Fis domain n=1 Tax=Paraliobacillus ryukyuensis TaxID=200904 RepID=A0A366E4U3_9BACI|nr:sigma 54-interacting transcriptional regulator [Paraliobacillus ryukyuensis]RBO97115.1 transcriptional regulator with PAS, ATPase and Fis domain [Paraliobacillus ryukyuensis]
MDNKFESPANPTIQENIHDMPSALFVTDAKGNILISNEFTALTVGMRLDELITHNVEDLVRLGYYDDSITMEAIKTKKRVCRTVHTNKGFSVLSTATPLMYENGEVRLVITTSFDYKEKFSKNNLNHHNSDRNQDVIDTENGEIVTESLAMKNIINVCNQIALFDSKVFIYGESGTGKEVIARYIHKKSNRKDGPFISINCASISPSLFELELFGYEKGSFVGATDNKMGVIEAANDGILFLDEISEIPLDMQAKLLHVMESSELRRIGGVKSLPINCRIIAASNRDLWNMVRKGMFREDLFYRINVIPIHIPPLRSRRSDLVGLISTFIEELNNKYNKNFVLRAEDFQQIINHNWPGNVRELKNYIERLVVTGQTDTVQYNDEIGTDWFAFDYFIKKNQGHFSTLKDFTAITEGRYIKQVLAACNDNATEAANQLGVHRSVIYRKLNRMKEILKENLSG